MLCFLLLLVLRYDEVVHALQFVLRCFGWKLDEVSYYLALKDIKELKITMHYNYLHYKSL